VPLFSSFTALASAAAAASIFGAWLFSSKSYIVSEIEKRESSGKVEEGEVGGGDWLHTIMHSR
jgi:hypothetical protein